ncbi:MAG: glucose-6-phosphate dehydrogenase [Candidatus Taylorbacteria bacterium RIFCSPHIGHO2_01_FULL_51_15]|uniref:Glucose-6-phosphate 1-dehydrogenase n=1 Tax=Candidatus Taylorbacteria bacterium RIFCSPHIGHO2_01_FULL_51_15 TaxID=1802304 RepID=A0A1G2MD35_9BACT|nr:MAG: glucose-6-phosphate dehydrogenase [Candidatus Taylorbacteria bacterium RIFCSPHIGHO2_01_FULL_51_15]
MSQKPLTIVIFGATGDLFQKKLAGALFDLHEKKLLPESTKIVGFSRKSFSHDQFRAFIQNSLSLRAGGKILEPDEFIAKAWYHAGDLNNKESYVSLEKFLEEHDRLLGACSDKLFYLAVPPTLYETVFKRLSASDLTIPCAPGLPDEEKAWTRVLVEKPFGNNEKEAARLDRMLGTLFEEEQIFRIDHYLAKETMQNIVSFRFSNGLFEPLWNRRHVERVEVTFLEKDGVSSRGPSYDPVGALRDVGQNHLLQMLALVAMENPKDLDAKELRAARAKVLRYALLAKGDLAHSIVRGQYEGYKGEAGIAPDSATETYFKLKMSVKNNRWRGIPFYLESGKALKESNVAISVFFKPTPCLCPEGHTNAHQNVLSFGLFPRAEISIVFWAKKPGFHFQLEPKRLAFSFPEGALAHEVPDAYERVLLDAIRGDQTLFPSTEEVKRQWKIITPILEKWTSVPLHVYEKGSKGPTITEQSN